MQYKLAEQVKVASQMLIKTIAEKAHVIPDFIPLADGSPSPETFPFAKLKKYSAMAYDINAEEILSYGPEKGMSDLVAEIEKWLVKRGFDLKDEVITVTPGSGSGMDMICLAFCDKGDTILTEEFTYPGILNAARMVQAEIAGVKMDPDGINVEALEKKAAETRPKMLYLVPTFSNPCGSTLPLAKRQAIYKLAQKYDFMIYEDDPYSQLKFQGEKYTEFKKLDTDGRVVRAETFSKILSSGMRVGFLIYNKAIHNSMLYSFGNTGLVSGPTQQAVAEFMKHEDLDAQIRSTTAFYENKCKAALAALDKYLPAACTRTNPEGGMFVWVTCPDSVDTYKLCFELIEQDHVGIVPSAAFAANPKNNPGHGFRLCYSFAPVDQIEEGIKRISAKIGAKLGN